MVNLSKPYQVLANFEGYQIGLHDPHGLSNSNSIFDSYKIDSKYAKMYKLKLMTWHHRAAGPSSRQRNLGYQNINPQHS